MDLQIRRHRQLIVNRQPDRAGADRSRLPPDADHVLASVAGAFAKQRYIIFTDQFWPRMEMHGTT